MASAKVCDNCGLLEEYDSELRSHPLHWAIVHIEGPDKTSNSGDLTWHQASWDRHLLEPNV